MKKSNIFSVDLQNRKRRNPKPLNVLHLVHLPRLHSLCSLENGSSENIRVQTFAIDQDKPLNASRANLALARPAHSHSLPLSTTSLIPMKNKKLGHKVCYGVI